MTCVFPDFHVGPTARPPIVVVLPPGDAEPVQFGGEPSNVGQGVNVTGGQPPCVGAQHPADERGVLASFSPARRRPVWCQPSLDTGSPGAVARTGKSQWRSNFDPFGYAGEHLIRRSVQGVQSSAPESISAVRGHQVSGPTAESGFVSPVCGTVAGAPVCFTPGGPLRAQLLARPPRSLPLAVAWPGRVLCRHHPAAAMLAVTVPPRPSGRVERPLRSLRYTVSGGKGEVEGGAVVDGTLGPGAPAVALDDPLHAGQADAGAGELAGGV